MRDKPIFEYWVLLFFVPVGVVFLLNGVVRPLMESALGGTMVRTSNNIRRGDIWWMFDDATRADHPLLTGFLADYSNGAIALTGVVTVIGLMTAGWVVKQVRSRLPR